MVEGGYRHGVWTSRQGAPWRWQTAGVLLVGRSAITVNLTRRGDDKTIKNNCLEKCRKCTYYQWREIFLLLPLHTRYSRISPFLLSLRSHLRYSEETDETKKRRNLTFRLLIVKERPFEGKERERESKESTIAVFIIPFNLNQEHIEYLYVTEYWQCRFQFCRLSYSPYLNKTTDRYKFSSVCEKLDEKPFQIGCSWFLGVFDPSQIK